MTQNPYRIIKSTNRSVSSRLPCRIEHTPESFDFPAIEGDGYGVRICIIDTGFPHHAEIAVPMTNIVNFTNSEVAQDIHGHGTGIAGIIKSKGPNLVGLAPMADVFYAKAFTDEGVAEHGSVQAAVLYSIVKNIDIVVMSFGSESAHPVLSDAIKKGYARGMMFFASSGVMQGSVSKDAEYPARYSEVMSVGFGAVKNSKPSEDGVFSIDFSQKSIDTAFLENNFTKMTGTSILPPVAAGIAARILQRRKSKNESVSPVDIYEEMISLKNKA